MSMVNNFSAVEWGSSTMGSHVGELQVVSFATTGVFNTWLIWQIQLDP